MTAPTTNARNGASNGSGSPNGAGPDLFKNLADLGQYVPGSIPSGWELKAARDAASHPTSSANTARAIRHQLEAIYAASQKDEHVLTAEAFQRIRVGRAARHLPAARTEFLALQDAMVDLAQARVRLEYLRWAAFGWCARRMGWVAQLLLPVLVVLEAAAAAIALKRIDPLLSPGDAYALTAGAGLSVVLVAKGFAEAADRRHRAERAATLGDDHPLRVAAPHLCRKLPIDLLFSVLVLLIGVLAWGLAMFGSARGGSLYLVIGFLTAAASAYLGLAHANEVADLVASEVREHRRLARRAARLARSARHLRKVLGSLAVGGHGVEVSSERRLGRRAVAAIEGFLRMTHLPDRAPDFGAVGNMRNGKPAVQAMPPSGDAVDPPRRYLDGTDRRELDGVQAACLMLRDAERLLDGTSTRRLELAIEQEERRQKARYAKSIDPDDQAGTTGSNQ